MIAIVIFSPATSWLRRSGIGGGPGGAMMHDHLSRIKCLTITLVCLLFMSQVASSTITSAHSGFVQPADSSPTWSEPASLSNCGGSANCRNPDIAVCSDGTAYIVWEHGPDLEIPEIWYSYSDDLSEGWSEARPVQWTLSSERTEIAKGLEPAIAVSSDCVLHLVWSRSWWGDFEIFYTYKERDHFVVPANVSNTSKRQGQSAQPDIAIDSSGEPRVVWVDTVSGGPQLREGWPAVGFPGLWSSDEIPGTVGNAQVPALAVDHKDRFHLTWMRQYGTALDILYKWQEFKWEEQANKWTPWANNLSESPGPGEASRLPEIAISGNKVVVVWQETVDRDDEIYVRWRQLDTDERFSPIINLSNTDASSRAPAVTADNHGHFFVAWDEGGSAEAIWTRSWMGVGDWGSVREIPNGGIKVRDPAMAISPLDDRLYAVWARKNRPEDETWDIYFSDIQLEIYQFYLAPIINKR